MSPFGLKPPYTILLLVVALMGSGIQASAQFKAYERTFNESPAAIQKALQKLRGAMSGHLPTLDGFASAGEHSFERYQRAYFQVTAQVGATSTGKSLVRVSAKVTAWYDDPAKAHSGYELLTSNGRIENDILDQLTEEVAANRPEQKQPLAAPSKPEVVCSTAPKQAEPSLSAPQPRVFDSPSVSSSLAQGLTKAAGGSADNTQAKPADDPERAQLRDELDQLQEVLKNQSHPNNMAAVKKSGTAVVSTPSLTAKPMFLATAHDEFEILNYTQDWVHVRVSGLSRGWIWRNDLELPDTIPDTPTAPTSPRSAQVFHIVREETAQFPGDWGPLRGKNVRLISVQKIDESSKDSGPQLKLDFAKSAFDRGYAEMVQKPDEVAGVVLIFDSADGGMIAAPQSTLAKWKSGGISDSAFWQSCYFDPPEAFTSGGTSASQ